MQKPMATMFERIEAMIRGEALPPPVAKLIGFDLISVEPGKALVELQATQVHANPNDRPDNFGKFLASPKACLS